MKAIVVSASSDIGAALCRRWLSKGWEVAGTYRTASPLVAALRHEGVAMVHCDLVQAPSVQQAAEELCRQSLRWDVLIFAPGMMEPIGLFAQVDFHAWEQGVQVNLLRPLSLLHRLLPLRAKSAKVLFFAGGGTNNAVLHYTSYALSKVALIKMCEFLAAEMPDTRFTIVGPGWVKTKIHEATLKAGAAAGANYERTTAKYSNSDWTEMEEVVECCHWLVTTSCDAVNGRNFSVAFDPWGTREIEEALFADSDMYKLRRHKNGWSSSDE